MSAHIATQAGEPDYAPTIARIIDLHRQRQDLLRAELRLNNQIEAVYRRLTGLKALERARIRKKASNGADPVPGDTLRISVGPADDTANGGDPENLGTQYEDVPTDLATFRKLEAVAAIHTAPMVEARTLLAESRKPIEKRMEFLARQLPVWPWVEGVRGFGALGLAQIVGECRDLSDYPNPAKVWKRMGLAVMPDGQRQRKVADKEQGILHGYSPQRRSIMYVIADSLMKGNRDGEYRAYYLAEKERQGEKLPDAPAAHIDNRARRHLAKRLLRDLWRAWWACEWLSPYEPVPNPPATFLAAD